MSKITVNILGFYFPHSILFGFVWWVVTFVKNWASITSFTGDQDSYSLEESRYERGAKCQCAG